MNKDAAGRGRNSSGSGQVALLTFMQYETGRALREVNVSSVFKTSFPNNCERVKVTCWVGGWAGEGGRDGGWGDVDFCLSLGRTVGVRD